MLVFKYRLSDNHRKVPATFFYLMFGDMGVRFKVGFLILAELAKSFGLRYRTTECLGDFR
ncbi:hypothetical protein Poly21_54900 [Allorhodopirellula heiligendammensis]|uniref:Uncharacterized protein n=1 Tax=Allorhodopirellula heiligendammensis TaxID=2714739 RepID=A0A5C6BEM7_9BACT|nr:hypothetical protein Poly21_54900 [Allorhodopirellula heiligendammensis]